MKVVAIGRGSLGGALAALWREAGHDVTELGREGGDASGTDAVLLAVPSESVADAIARVSGLDGIPVMDATNPVRVARPDGFDSIALYVKSLTGGPVAKAFNTNYARIFDRLAETTERPSMLYAADDEARAVTETLIRDAGFDPVDAGDLSAARAVEDFVEVVFAVVNQRGPFLYRIY